MSDRIPLWVHLGKTPQNQREVCRDAATQVGAERVVEADPDDCTRVVVTSAADQTRAQEEPGIVLVDGQDWAIIPLENLIASRRDRPGTLFAVARTPEEAARFRGTLEIGVHGILLEPMSESDILETDELLRMQGSRSNDETGATKTPPLALATITKIEDAGMAERVCIDCTERFHDGEGLLIGSTAKSFALVHAETLESEYVNARPFRVNAGAVHSYIMGKGGRTQYLSEIEAGSKVQAMNVDGTSRILVVGRAKIELRPHTLLAWETADGATASAILQTAETVRLMDGHGSATSVTALKVGDQIMVQPLNTARHFGMPVQESLVEK